VPAKLIALCIDAGEEAALHRWAADGTLPALGGLLRRGLRGTVRSLEGFHVGSTWASFTTASHPAHHGFHYLVQLRPGTYDLYHPADEGMYLREAFWRPLSRAGKRVAILDVPMVPLDRSVNGIHVIEWGGHDAQGGFAAWPPEVERQIAAEFGPHPTPSNCDGIARTPAGFAEFTSGLERGAATRAAWTRQLLAREEWDLLLLVFSESHCGGHQAWHLHDPRHPGHDPGLAAGLGDPIRRTYRAIDAAIGRILEDAGDATVIVFSCHGMGCWSGAHHLLRDILVRLGVTEPSPAPAREPLHRAALRRVWRALPQGAQGAVRALLGRPASKPAAPSPGPWHARVSEGDQRSRCFPLMNGLAVSGIRLNLRGREPAGMISPGAEQEAFEAQLAADLLAITDERTGGPLVRRVLRSRDLLAGEHLDILPDLLVEWDDTAGTGNTQVGGGRGATVRARSPMIGVVEGTNRYGRTGEHRREGFFVAAGPGIRAGELAEPLSTMDLGPTFAALLGVPLPGVDGRPAELT
jgi:predicted AlkP superfamily phosphohydrolase/phosphomutase